MTPQNRANNNGNNRSNSVSGINRSSATNGINGSSSSNSGSSGINGSKGNNGYGQDRSEEEPKKRITDTIASDLCILYLLLMPRLPGVATV